MSRLILMRDPLRGGREYHELTQGANLADELRRLFPDGIRGQWYLYRSEALPENQIDWQLHPATIVDDGIYLLIVRPQGGLDVVALLWSLAISLAISAIVYWLTPRPKQERPPDEDIQSPNNRLAGQTNTLRPGGRVPDILGRVRSYPDLICNVVEEWQKRNQQLRQLFVIGVGAYDIADIKLGETPILSISGATPLVFQPGDTVPQYALLKQSPEVGGVSLLTEDEAAIPSPGADFFAATKTVSLEAAQPWANNIPLAIGGSSFNNGLFWLVGVSVATSPPYVYTLEGPVADETDANPVFSLLTSNTPVTRSVEFGFGEIFDDPGVVPYQCKFQELAFLAIGVVIEIKNTTHTYRGRVTNLYTTTDAGHTLLFSVIRMNDLYGVPINFLADGYYVEASTITLFSEGDPPTGGGPTSPPSTPAPTNWYRVPLKNPDEIWFDIGFPQGLVAYLNGIRTPITISGQALIRRPGGTLLETAGVGWTHTESTSGPLRYTHRVVVSLLRVNFGSDPFPPGDDIEIQFQRNTTYFQENATHQYMQDTTLDRLAGMKWQAPRTYPDCTVVMLTMANNRSSVRLGETSFNCVATRKLPTWTGSAWSAPAPTQKWADNLVARMKAKDGANKLDAEIDLAGIYALQATLDAQDAGDQGKISLTLDQVQDIDSELQSIALVVRSQVYRVGKKLFVTRDQGGKTPLALFTGRSKQMEGEQVQLSMSNDSDADCVVVTWVDRDNGWKIREYQYPVAVVPVNPLRISPPQATWAQAWRRAVYEWNRLTYRRDTLTMQATEEARLLHIGDVINVADDIANMAQTAGEVIAVAGLTLTLDKPINVSAGGFTVLLRSMDGRVVESKTITQGATQKQIVIASATSFEIKGRDDSVGTMFAVYLSAAAVIRPWLVTNLEPGPQYTRVLGQNWRTEVFDGDVATLPLPPEFEAARRVVFEIPESPPGAL